MIRQGGDGGGLDLLAVQRDDELLDLLGARRAVSDADEVGRLLAALAAEVDDAMPKAPFVVAAPGSAAAPAADTPGHARRLGAAGVAAAVLLGGSVAMSGAAAAVTGDPLAPYKTVGHAVGTVGHAVGHAVGNVGSAVGNALSLGEDDLPEQAATIAHLNKRVAGARAALAHGDTAQVQAVVDELTAVLATADLSDEQRAALQQKLDRLEDSLAKAASSTAERGRSADRATAAATPVPREGTAKGGGGKAADPDTEDPAQDKAPADKAPADKAPADKAPADQAPADNAPDDPAPEDKAPADHAPADKAPADKAPADGGGGDPSGGATSGTTQQQAPAPQATAGSTGGARDRAGSPTGGTGGADPSQQSTELGADPTEPRGQGASRR